MSASKQRAGSTLTLRLAGVLALGSVVLSFVVTMAASEGTREQRIAELHGRQEEVAASLARRAAPLLERGDDLRLSVLATSAAELVDGRVLILDAVGRVRLDTGLSMGGRVVPLETSNGPVRRPDFRLDGAWEVLAPALGQEGGAGEVRIRYRLDAATASSFPWSLFGLILLCSVSLITLASWIAHAWVQRIRDLTRQAQSMVRGEARPSVHGLGSTNRDGAVAELEHAVLELGAAHDDAAERTREACLNLARELVHAMELRGHVTPGHPERTRALALALADEVGASEAERDDLAAAALLAELGKAGVRPSALAKLTGLDDVERASLRQHPVRGAQLVAQLPGFDGVALAIRHQHEKWDGGGFPDGLRAERIPWTSRVLAIVSAYETMAGGGVHGDPMSWPDALDRLREDRGDHFDPDLVDAFETIIRRSPPRELQNLSISTDGVVPHRAVHGETRREQMVFEDEAVEDLLACSDGDLEVVYEENLGDRP